MLKTDAMKVTQAVILSNISVSVIQAERQQH